MLQQPDPRLSWTDFPRTELRRDRTVLYRAARNGNGPWWFCACGKCRFDLKRPRGTCYTSTDALCGLLECVGQRRCLEFLPPLEPGYLKQWTIHELEIKTKLQLANLTHRKAAGYGITNELSSMPRYRVPKQFAKVFDESRGPRGGRRFHGIRYRTRFDPGPQARGVALFGDHGEQDWESKEIKVDDKIVAELQKIGIVVLPPPALADMEVDAA
jgi:hypothetical protein